MRNIKSSFSAWMQLSLLLPLLCGAALHGGTVIQDGVVYTTHSTYAVVTGLTGGYPENTLVIPSAINGLPVKEVAKRAFSEVAIDRLILPDSIQTLKSSAFDACTVKSLSLGNGLKTIEQYAFDDCYGLTSLTVPDSVTSIGRVAFDIDDLESISLPNKCTLASSDLFDEDAPLKSIYIRGGKPNYTINLDSFYPKPTIYLEVPGISTLWGCPVEYNSPTAVQKVEVTGETTIPYGGSASYICKATYRNGTTATVTPAWSLSSTSYASVTSAGEVTNRNTTYAPQEVTLTASYTSDGITKQGTLALSLEGRPNELNGLQILGEASTSPGVDTRYAAQASYANGDRRPVSPDWSVISGGQFASISADGILSIASLPVEMALVIRAAYSEGDVTKECTMSVSAKPSVFAGSVFEYTYVFRPGWQQVSIVLNLDAASKAALLALRPIVYDGRAYSHATDLSAGTSCWIFASEKTTVKVSGTPCGVLKTTQ